VAAVHGLGETVPDLDATVLEVAEGGEIDR
jgi:hypothetical protein